MAMRPHTGWRVWWLGLHGLGVYGVVLFGWDFFAWYAVGVAVLEGAALVRKALGKTADGTWSWATWDYLHGGDGPALLRHLLVAAWSLWFCGSFVLHGWFGPGVNAFVGLGFLVWLWAHFFGFRPRGVRGTATATETRPKTGENDG